MTKLHAILCFLFIKIYDSSGSCDKQLSITITRLYNFDPLKPQFYIVKLGFIGVNIIFIFLLKNIDCGYSLESPVEAVLTSTHNLRFEQKYEKYPNFLSENIQFLVV